MNRRKGFLIATAVTMGFLTAAPGAMAGKPDPVKTKVTIDTCSGLCRADAPRGLSVTFFGKVKSKSDRCLGNRSVRLFRSDDPDELVNSTTTDEDGNWSIPVIEPEPGQYYAESPKIKRGNKKCLAGQSKMISPQMRRDAAERAKPKKAKTKTSFKIQCLICPRRPTSERLGVPLEFSGKVKSKAGKCVEGRTVRVIQTTGNIQVAETTTESNGTWTATTIGGFNEYRAVVTKEKRGNLVCKSAKPKPKTASP